MKVHNLRCRYGTYRAVPSIRHMDYKRTAFLEADKRCSNTVRSMESNLRQACHAADARVDRVIKNFLTCFGGSIIGNLSWVNIVLLSKLVSSSFASLSCSLEGPIKDAFEKQLHQTDSERGILALKCCSNEDKLGLLKKQLTANEKHRSEYMKRYEDAIIDKKRMSEDLSSRIVNLKSKCSTIDECCIGLSKDLDDVRRESSDWRNKYDHCDLELRRAEETFNAQKSILESSYTVTEGRFAVAHEQVISAQEEALEWKRKYDIAAGEAKAGLERSGLVPEWAKDKALEREDVKREEWGTQLLEKAAESKVARHKSEHLGSRNEIKELLEKVDSMKVMAQSHENQSKILEQEKEHLEEKLLSEIKNFDETEERIEYAERGAKIAVELADAARAELVIIQKDKSEAQRLALERLAVIERVEEKIDSLEHEKAKLMDEIERLHQSDALSKVSLLERRVEEREKEIEDLLCRSNEQRSSTVHVFESLLATERAAQAEANCRAEAMSLQLQATQSKLDKLHQELTSILIVETALDSKLRTVSHRKRSRDNYIGTTSMENTEDGKDQARGAKRSKSTNSLLKFDSSQGDGPYKGEDSRFTEPRNSGN
ncbi:hypothetical protein GW17_00039837 [Ensete ventricosum]|nr:hypothetical protein GW17_00039837 [Ensete ventricosum]